MPNDFISADIGKIAAFESQSQEAIAEFDAIIKEFNTINSSLLKKWEGDGADAYKEKTDHILENVGGIKDVLDGINNGVVKNIKEQYMALDKALEEFNLNPPSDVDNLQ
jgi:hypothetical protein